MAKQNKANPPALEELDEASLIAGIGNKSSVQTPNLQQTRTEHNQNDIVNNEQENRGGAGDQNPDEKNNNNSLHLNDNINNLDSEKHTPPNEDINGKTEQNTAGNKNSKKRTIKVKDFDEFFSSKEIIKERTATYVSGFNHERLSKIVAFKPGSTISSYLNNIINEHMNLYADEPIIGNLTLKDIVAPKKE
ncbi:DUF3408 domain-containing protein [Pedobacter sp. P351]|uniref:DUF3408 domain-containing protein n=1 Tax=Pedobacter superstes TaxID=3133441 RepID=UPI00309EFAC3